MIEFWRRKGRRLIEGGAECLVNAVGWNKRVRRTMLRKLCSAYLPPTSLGFAAFEDHGFFVSLGDQTIGYELLSGKPWQRDILLSVVALLEGEGCLKPGGRFLDVGANIGSQTVYALLSGRFAGGVAIEAEPGNFQLLTRNITYNNFSEVVAVRHAAACAVPGAVRLRINRRNGGGHSIHPGRNRSASEVVDVDGDTVDHILADVGAVPSEVSLAWIDVEGLELDVLAGMGGVRGASVPILFEYSGELHGAEDWVRLRAMLARTYTHVALIGTGTDQRLHKLENFAAPRRQVDILVCRP